MHVNVLHIHLMNETRNYPCQEASIAMPSISSIGSLEYFSTAEGIVPLNIKLITPWN